MRLNALGQLRLEGEKFRREKPLLLLAYLSLEGPRPRRFLAELFWPGAPNPMNNLAVALAHLRKFGSAAADDSRMWSTSDCDAAELRLALRAGQFAAAGQLYRGAFADGAGTEETGAELEEWLLCTREELAREWRSALLYQAEQDAAAARFSVAAAQAEAAYRVPGAPPLEAEDLPRFYRLLRATDHPLAGVLEREARELDLPLGAPAETVRGHLTPPFAGRIAELKRLRALRPGEWAWVRGGTGLGKTALLRELSLGGGVLLSGRSGLPYATLEPLLGDPAGDEATLLRRLMVRAENLSGPLLLDDWPEMDPESQGLLERLLRLRPASVVVLTGPGEAPLTVDLNLELGALGEDDLSALAGAHAATGGLPALVGAYMRGEPLEAELGARLRQLGEGERQLYAALTLLPDPDLGVARQALNWSGAALVQAQTRLLEAGLVEPSGAVRGRAVALHHLSAQPPLTRQLLGLALARLLPPGPALPLYQQARALWEAPDLRRVQLAYQDWGQELLRRGFARKAAELLQDAPVSPALTLLRARALERGNQFRQSLELLADLSGDGHPVPAEVDALRSRLLFKLGFPEQARAAAQAAMGGPLEAEAEALNTLGELELRSGGAQAALALFSRSATLWQACGQRSRWLWSLNNRAAARIALGQPTAEVFAEVLEAADDDFSAQAAVRANMGNGFLAEGDSVRAQFEYRQAIALGLESGALSPAAMAWNSLGVMWHAGQPAQARDAYRQGLALCEHTGDAYITAILLANLAELEHDLPAWEQSIELLERSGFLAMAGEFRADLQAFRQASNTV
jgi:hypothetical protein